MIANKSVLAIIPARGGSKGIPRKNIRKIAKKPMIAWTIEEVKKSKYVDRVILSSDDSEIISIALKYGCEVPFVRPDKLSKDETPGIEPIIHAIKMIPEQYDYIVLLQPTSPLRKSNDIDNCLELCIKKKMPACISITEVHQNPYWMFCLGENGRIKPFLSEFDNFAHSRQQLPKIFTVNGAVYVAEVEWLLTKKRFLSKQTLGYIMGRNQSVDIDDELDLLLCELLLRNVKSSLTSEKFG